MTSFAGNRNLIRTLLESDYCVRNVREEWIESHAQVSRENLRLMLIGEDLRSVTQGEIPWQVRDAHNIALGLSVLVQIEDVINLSSSDPRAARANTIQAVLSDGAQEFVAIELLPLRGALTVGTIPGTKLILRPSCLIRRGRVLLTPDNVQVIGAPRSNIWGDSYKERKMRALVSAGLPLPEAFSFDTWSAEGPNVASRNTSLPNMGGIAQVTITDEQREMTSGDELDIDDDAFWNQAVAAEAQIVQNSRAQSHGITNPNARAVNPIRSMHGGQIRPEGNINQFQGARRNTATEIPQQMSNGDHAQRNMVQSKTLLSYIHQSMRQEKSSREFMLRAFALRCRMHGDNESFVLRVAVDDGTGIAELELDQSVTDEITGGLSGRQILEKSKSEGEASFREFKSLIRSRVRNIQGFLRCSWIWDSCSVVSVREQPAEGMDQFLRTYVRNVESRWEAAYSL